MKTVVIEKTYYTIDELKEVNIKGYNTAHEDFIYMNQDCYHWEYEAIESIEKFLDLFNCTLDEFRYGGTPYDTFSFTCKGIWTYDEEENDILVSDLEEIKGENIKTYIDEMSFTHKDNIKRIINNYNEWLLTGYHLDEVLLKPLYDFLNNEQYKEYSLYDILYECLSDALECINEDYEYQLSEESFKEYCYSNNLLFDIDGNPEE